MTQPIDLAKEPVWKLIKPQHQGSLPYPSQSLPSSGPGETHQRLEFFWKVERDIVYYSIHSYELEFTFSAIQMHQKVKNIIFQ